MKPTEGINQQRLKNIIENQLATNKLDLSNLHFGQEGLGVLLPYLRTHKRLVQLELKGNQLDSDSTNQLVDALRSSCPALQSLSLESNPILLPPENDPSASAPSSLIGLHRLLTNSPNIRALSLSRCSLSGPEAVDYLAKIIKESSLTHFDLRWNDLKDQDLEVLIKAIENSRTKKLQFMPVIGNQVSEPKVYQVDRALEKNKGTSSSALPEYYLPPIASPHSFEVSSPLDRSPFLQRPEAFEERVFPPSAIPPRSGHSMELQILLEEEKRRFEIRREEMLNKLANLQREAELTSSEMLTFQDEKVLLTSRLDQSQAVLASLKNEYENLKKEVGFEITKLNDEVGRVEMEIIEKESSFKNEITRRKESLGKTEKEKEREWQRKCENLEKEIERLEMQREEYLNQVENEKGALLGMEREFESRSRELPVRIQEEEFMKYQKAVNDIDSRLALQEDECQNLDAKNISLMQTISANTTEFSNAILRMQRDHSRLKNESGSFVTSMNELKSALERAKQERELRLSLKTRMESEFAELERLLEEKKISTKSKLETVCEEHERDFGAWAEERELQNERIGDLEREVDRIGREIESKREAWSRIEGALRERVGQAVYDVFSREDF